MCLADEMLKIPHTAAVQCIPSDSEEESDIYALEEDWEDRVSNFPRKVRVNVLSAGRKIE